MGNVFISYSHDSQAHKERVLELSNRLRRDGIDCGLDQYETSPAEGWPKWIDRKLEQGHFILVVCTQTYWKHVRGEEEPGVGQGAKWESTLIYNHIYGQDSQTSRFIPVVFEPGDAQYIPAPLRGASYYNPVSLRGYRELLGRLQEFPPAGKLPLGRSQPLPPEQISLHRLPNTGETFLGREKQLEQLHKAWEAEHTFIISFIAWGGVGKSALVNQWLSQMGRENYKGARRVYGWSFYSQGAREEAQVSADPFFHEALKWFGDPNPKESEPTARARRLVALIRKQPVLLVLDGVEPLQHPPGRHPGFDGRFKDAGLKVLLRELAVSNPGLCVVTSREPLADLDTYRGRTLHRVDLEHLSAATGIRLLSHYGIAGSDAQLAEAVDEYRGHALALTLLARFLAVVHGGDIRKRDLIPRLVDERDKGYKARRVMAAYEHWLGDSTERNILYLMGLFDRPAPLPALEALRAEPIISGVTSKLVDLSEVDWNYAVSHLRGLQLLSGEGIEGEEGGTKRGAPGAFVAGTASPSPSSTSFPALDCHPLVREFFADRLQKENPEGWRSAHLRLYDYYNSLPKKELPDTLEDMEPLFAAIPHGCRAGKVQETLYEVFWKRILQEEEFYSWHKLGAYGANIAALSHFFHTPWQRPSPELSEFYQAEVVGWSAFVLRALGRLQEAWEPMKAGMTMRRNQEDWKNAAIDAGNLSELVLILGRVSEAADYGKLAVDMAGRSGDDFQKEGMLTFYASALHQLGKPEQAEALFLEAEEMLKKREPQEPYLYSLKGYRFCELLLAQGRVKEVMQRVKKTLEISIQHNWLLAIALDRLTLGRTMMQEAQVSGVARQGAGQVLHEAVQGLRKAAAKHHIPRGLLARAAWFRLQKEYGRAAQDLKEVLEFAQACPFGECA